VKSFLFNSLNHVKCQSLACQFWTTPISPQSLECKVFSGDANRLMRRFQNIQYWAEVLHEVSFRTWLEHFCPILLNQTLLRQSLKWHSFSDRSTVTHQGSTLVISRTSTVLMSTSVWILKELDASSVVPTVTIKCYLVRQNRTRIFLPSHLLMLFSPAQICIFHPSLELDSHPRPT